jgi:hypothetical protein
MYAVLLAHPLVVLEKSLFYTIPLIPHRGTGMGQPVRCSASSPLPLAALINWFCEKSPADGQEFFAAR